MQSDPPNPDLMQGWNYTQPFGETRTSVQDHCIIQRLPKVIWQENEDVLSGKTIVHH